ncbi:MAG: hypothetical protein IPH40_03940 [Polaromonas sp.]|nr:hypothetical protein [Polaromonas sp.]
MDKPFLGALVLRLPLKSAGAWCRTMATDARAIYYNPEWVNYPLHILNLHWRTRPCIVGWDILRVAGNVCNARGHRL